MQELIRIRIEELQKLKDDLIAKQKIDLDKIEVRIEELKEMAGADLDIDSKDSDLVDGIAPEKPIPDDLFKFEFTPTDEEEAAADKVEDSKGDTSEEEKKDEDKAESEEDTMRIPKIAIKTSTEVDEAVQDADEEIEEKPIEDDKADISQDNIEDMLKAADEVVVTDAPPAVEKKAAKPAPAMANMPPAKSSAVDDSKESKATQDDIEAILSAVG